MTQIIYKYPLDMGEFWANSQTVVSLPKHSSMLTIALQEDKAMLWALIDKEEKEIESRLIAIYGTGWDIHEQKLRYINTIYPGPYVFHFFEILGEDQ